MLIPPEVASEFKRLSGGNPRFTGLELPKWIEIVPAPPPPPAVVAANLDVGESAAIALCLAQSADALLVDESLGRVVAFRLGRKTIGILGILLDARKRGLIARITPILNRLEQEAGFWIAPDLRARVLQLARE